MNRSASGTWGAWKSPAPGLKFTSGPTIATRPSDPSRIDITVRKDGGSMWHAYSTAPATITGSEDLGGVLTPTASPTSLWWRPSAASTAERYDTYVLGGANQIYQKAWNNSWSNYVTGWAPSWPIPTSSPVVPLARRSDPTTRDFLIPTDGSAVPKSYLQSRFDTWVAHDTPETALSLDLTTWSPMRTHVYWNAVGVLGYAGNQVRIDQAKQWFLPSAHPTTAHPYAQIDDWIALDFRKEAARRWWLYGADNVASCTGDGADVNRRAALDLIACGYHGLWLDDVEFTFNAFRYWDTATATSLDTSPAGITQAEWNDALSQLLKDLRQPCLLARRTRSTRSGTTTGSPTARAAPTRSIRAPCTARRSLRRPR